MRLLPLLLALLAPAALAQQTYDQVVLGEILDRPGFVPETPIRYARYRVEHPSGNAVRARHALYEHVAQTHDAVRAGIDTPWRSSKSCLESLVIRFR